MRFHKNIFDAIHRKTPEETIVNTAIIESAAAPRKTIYAIPADREQEGSPICEASDVQLLSDKDACWLKKGNKNFFGYKSFVTVSAEQGYVEKVSATPANVSEFRHFEKAIEGVETSRYCDDKGSSFAENRAILKKIHQNRNYVCSLQKQTALALAKILQQTRFKDQI